MPATNSINSPRKTPSINKYLEDGYTVTEMYFPNTNTYIRTKEKETLSNIGIVIPILVIPEHITEKNLKKNRKNCLKN